MADRDDLKLIGKPKIAKMVRTQSRTHDGLCLGVVIAAFFAIVSLVAATFAVTQVLELSDTVARLQMEYDRNTPSLGNSVGSVHTDDITDAPQYDNYDADDYVSSDSLASSSDDADERDADDDYDDIYRLFEGDWDWRDNFDQYQSYEDEPRRVRRAAKASKHGTHNGNQGKRGKSPKSGNRLKRKCAFVTSSTGSLEFKAHNKQCSDSLTAHIKDVVEEQSGQAAIHLVGNITVSEEVRNRLARSKYNNLHMTHGIMYDLGYVPHEETLAFWTPSLWTHANTKTRGNYDVMPSQGEVKEVKVKVAGIYFIYSQLTYHESAISRYTVVKTSAGHSESQGLLSCMLDRAAIRTLPTYRTCHTSGLVRLEEGDRVSVSSSPRERHIKVSRPSFSYWGLIRVN